MNRMSVLAAALLLLPFTACAISEPNPPGADPGSGRNNFDLDSKENPIVVMETSMGTIKIRLYENAVPITVANFLKYVDDKHYDGTIFHRVKKDFMIQGGGFTPGMREKGSKYPPIKNEAGNGLSNVRGTIAMARTNVPDSATDQFYINVVDNSSNLNRRSDRAGYAVFGKVIDGMGVVDTIRAVPVDNPRSEAPVPLTDVMIKSIRRAESK